MIVKITLLLQIFLLFIEDSKADEAYLELNANNFESTLKKYDITLVKFYAEWCGHCKRMAPEFSSAAKVLIKNDPPVHLAKVNCPENQDLCQKYGVNGYPTLKIFRSSNGELQHEDYSGGRESDLIVKYMKSRAGPASILIKTEDDIKKYLEDDSSVFVAHIPDLSHESFKQFMTAAQSLRDHFKFLHIINPDKNVIRRYLPAKIQTKMEDPFLEFKLPSEAARVRTFMLDHWGGQLHWDQGDSNLIDSNSLPWVTIYFNLDYIRDHKGTNYVRNRLLKAIKQLREDGSMVKFAMASGEKNSQLLNQQFNLAWLKDSKPMVTVMDKGRKFVMPGEFSYEAFKTFVKNFENGKVEEYIKSEPVPDSQPDSVVKVVAKTFDEVVRNKNKFVFIEFFAPWCGHCKNLKPIYEGLAKKLQGESDITIAAMDATANDVPPDFTVTGFPTLYWVSKDNVIEKYEGGREEADFIKFIENKMARSVSTSKDEL